MTITTLYQSLVNRYQPLSRDTRSPQGMAAGQRGHIALQVGPTYQKLEIITSGISKTKLKRLSIELNGEQIVSLTGSEMVMLQQYKGNHTEEGRYIVDFADAQYRTKNGIRSGELVTLPTDELIVYIDLDDTIADDWTLRARSWITAAQPVRYFVPKIFGLTYDAAASGDNDLFWKNGSVTRFIRRLHFRANNINRLTVFRDDTKRHEVQADDNLFDLQLNGLVPQTGYFHFDPGQLKFGLEGLFPTYADKELKFVLNKASAGPVPILVELLEQVRPFDTAAG
ncbi:major capsid protein P2 [Ferrimonas balearica]|uniref:major capsid protein P2 n=1 Tax=Ferrimonas balearica TaxID=44012 RepID=UPI001C9A1CBB|nr:major capsid protein P2 [Ferrimonas balearica]MBY5920413.1 hypothetical protein [Ferrimonas balearica]MBY5996902.1 hypothetical protein [Ferrimonas balearica]